MDPAQALADLTEISSQIQSAVLLDRHGALIASTLGDDRRAVALAAAARALLAAVEEGREGLAQVEVATLEGSVFLARDAERLVAATTTPEPTVGLVFYDLKSVLRSVAAEPAKAGRAQKGKKADASP